MNITLDWSEVKYAASVGLERRLAALQLARGDRYGQPKGDLWSLDIEAAAAELAFAKARDRYWVPLADDPKTLAGDVGHVQIRSTKRADGCLITHPSDPDLAPFVLAVGQIPTFTFAGWMYGHETKQDLWWRTDTGRPAFFVPQSALHPMPSSTVQQEAA